MATPQLHNESTPQQQVHFQTEDEMMDEIEMEAQDKSIYDKVYDMSEKLAATRLGQFVIERGDYLLRMIEDTAKWSLPQDKIQEKLVRPFNWIIFLMLIITMRMIRMTLSIGAVMIGNSPVSAHDIVYFVQTRRRKLRAIRLHGLKEIRRKEEEANAMMSGSTKSGIIAKLQAIVSIAICRPGQHREPERRVFVHRRKEQLCEEQPSLSPQDRQTYKRPRDDENVEHNLTLDELLTKCANENSDDDPDFVPNEEDGSNTEESSSSENSTADEEEDIETNAEELTKKSKTNDDEITLIMENGGFSLMPKPIHDIKKELNSDSDQQITSKENGSSSGYMQDNEATQNFASPPTDLMTQKIAFNEKRKSTPGHESAALTALQKSFAPSATAAPQIDEYPQISTSFSYCIQSLSSTSLLSEEPIARNFDRLECISAARTSKLCSSPSVVAAAEVFTFSTDENSTISSASSTEDIFYSPIGSPLMFQAPFEPVSILKKPIVSITEASEASLDYSTPASHEELNNVESVDTSSHSAPKELAHKQAQPQRFRHKNKYRNSNRRMI